MRISWYTSRACIVFFGLAAAFPGCNRPTVIPSSYETYNAGDGSFQILCPKEWTSEGSGKGGYYFAKFTSGGAEISVETNIVGSLLGDIAKSGIMVPGMATMNQKEIPPVVAVHEQERAGFEDDLSVKEQAATDLKTTLGEARRSEFTGKKTFGGALHGYRITIVTSQNRVRVVCYCSEAEWKKLQPVFEKVIASVAPGKPMPY